MVTERKETSGKKPFVIPNTCPPLVRELIEKTGSGSAAARALGQSSSGGLNNIMHGTTALTDKMRERIEAVLRGEFIPPEPKFVAAGSKKKTKHAKSNGHAAEAPPVVTAAPAQPAPPPFVEWNGKSVPVTVLGKAGKPEKFKKCPGPLAQLLSMHGGSRVNVAKAMGLATGTSVTNILRGDREFDLKAQQQVHRALHGIAHRDESEFTAQDNFALGIAICLVSLSSYERLEELADVMKGAILMRKSAGITGWLTIWRFPKRDDLQSFKRLGIRDAKEIICP